MARRGRKPNSTKATTNSKSVKETKTMAKVTTSTKKATVNKVNAKETKDMVKETMTMELTAEEIKAIEAMRAGKTVEKKPATKAKGAKTEKNNFDKDLYYSIAETLGVLGKNGVYKVARPVVYGLMELDKIKKSDITKAKEQIVAIATEQKLTWLLEKLGVEAEEEAEDIDVDFEDIAQ